MKISFIAENDFANVLTEYSYCLNKHSEDIQSKSICYKKHVFDYSIQHDYDLETCNVEQKLEAKKWVEDSDVIIFGEEGHPLEQTYRTLREFSNLLGVDLINSGKKLIIWHPGSHYRQNSQFYNEHPLRGKISKHLYAFDLYKLSNKGLNDLPFLVYNYVNFNKKELISNFKNKLKLHKRIISHIPSNPKTKGTDIIINQLRNLPNNFEFITITGIPHSKVIEHKIKSLFYVDQFSNWGTYGVAAIEALLNSNMVFCTLHNTHEAITKLTGEPILPFIDLGTDPNQINSIISTYANLPDKDLIEIYEGIVQWVEEYYSPKGIINQIENIIK
jgi:hypothetical protein|tara:strand:- start:836 stop:1828 length:993 start_codon:yes stop_codon:yes gene_type:complete